MATAAATPMEFLDLDEKTTALLDLDRVVAYFAGHAVCSLGRESIAARRPRWGQPAAFEGEQRLLREMWALYGRHEDLPLAGLFDPRPLFERIGVAGTHLLGAEYARIAKFAAMGGPAAAFGRAHAVDQPLLGAIFARIEPLPAIELAVRRAIDERGEVRDDATPELKRLRAELRSWEGRLHSEIGRLTRQYAAAGVLSDNFHTVRGGRYCLPVAAGRRTAVPGIVHGVSNSGESFFIEPMEIVEQSNELAALHAREEEEVRRILIALADTIRPHLGALGDNVRAFAELDDLQARARGGWERGFSLPRFVTPGEPMRLDRVHHPLLRIERADASVPLDIPLARADRLLLLSGPNAGGKTTALKLVGLSSLLSQAGFPIPCGPETMLPVVRRLWVAIGDEQSVADGESTFSAHVRRLRSILENAREASLVLLDEVASGTDPTEGSALAIATLEEMLRRGARVFCTSHLSSLMDWASSHAGARNASFRLEPGTLRPTYELTLDVPGHSFALEAAERGGFPRPVLDRARALMPRERVRASELLLALEAKHAELDEKTRRQIAEAERLVQERAEFERRLAAHREERRTYREMLALEKAREVRRLREEVERRIASLPPREALVAAKEAIAEDLRGVREEVAGLRAEAPGAPPEQLTAGDEVVVAALRARGRVMRVDEERGTVRLEVRGIELEMPIAQLWSPVIAPPARATLPDLDEVERGEAEAARAAESAAALGAITRLPGRGLFRGRAPSEAAPAVGTQGSPEKKRKRSARKEQFDDAAFTASIDPSRPVRPGRADAKRPEPEGAAPRLRGDDKPTGGYVLKRAAGSGDVGLTIDLHGLRVEEALPRVDEYLDNALLSDWPFVKLMHGVGTGALARAIRAHLRDHPSIARAYPAPPDQGGSGVTIVEFKG